MSFLPSDDWIRHDGHLRIFARNSPLRDHRARHASGRGELTPGSGHLRRIPGRGRRLCAVVDGEPHGLVATSMTVGVSYDPPMVLFSVRNASSTWPTLRRAERIGISVLGESQGPLCRQIAAKNGNRFDGLETMTTPEGAIFVAGAVSWMNCSIVSEVPAGDHAVVLMQVHEVGHAEQTAPLVFHRSRFPVLRHD